MSSVKLKRKREEICKTTDTDRISNLPDEVTQKILECLPLQEAARTSILSSHWRYSWTLIAQLILDQSFLMSILPEKLESADHSLAYSKVVNNILLGHVGPVRKFVLYLPHWVSEKTDMVIPWLLYVRANGVKELTLDGRRITLPACLFSCVGLTHLTLSNCNILTLPPKFRGFPCLVSLKLQNFRFLGTSGNRETALETLISNCPVLECLYMSIIGLETNFTIRPPKLQDLCLDRLIMTDLSLCETTAIKRLDLNAFCKYFQNSRNTGDFFSCLPKVEELILKRLFWNALLFCSLTSRDKFPKELEKLQNLQLVEIPTNCRSSISFVLSLLHNSPNLELLSLVVGNYRESTYEFQIDESYHLKCLKHVHLINISGLNNELQLIKLILASSPVLREMSIEFGPKLVGGEEKYIFAKEVTRYSRASPHA